MNDISGLLGHTRSKPSVSTHSYSYAFSPHKKAAGRLDARKGARRVRGIGCPESKLRLARLYCAIYPQSHEKSGLSAGNRSKIDLRGVEPFYFLRPS